MIAGLPRAGWAFIPVLQVHLCPVPTEPLGFQPPPGLAQLKLAIGLRPVHLPGTNFNSYLL